VPQFNALGGNIGRLIAEEAPVEFSFPKVLAVFLLAVLGIVLLASSARGHSALDGELGVVLLMGALFLVWNREVWRFSQTQSRAVTNGRGPRPLASYATADELMRSAPWASQDISAGTS
jgi:hypothetical protein